MRVIIQEDNLVREPKLDTRWMKEETTRAGANGPQCSNEKGHTTSDSLGMDATDNDTIG